MSNILVLGGTGFVGRHLCERLQREGHKLTVPTRHPTHASAVQHLPAVTVRQADVHDPAQLAALVAGHDAVINLIAILHGNQDAFERVHVTLARHVVAACRHTGVRRVIHVSALGASEHGPSLYLRSKAAGEAVLQQAMQPVSGDAPGLDVTLLRPSVIFGADDRFMNLFGQLQRKLPTLPLLPCLPFIPLGGADARLQPVWVEDVVAALAHAVRTPSTVGQTLELGGPEVFTLRQLVHLAGQTVGKTHCIMGLPRALAYFQALLLECLPGEPVMSTDNLNSLEVDNVLTPVADGAARSVQHLADWGITPASLRGVLPTYLGANAALRGHTQRLDRWRAGGH